MLKYGNKDLRKRWIGNVNIANIHLGTTKIWPYITSTSVGDWVVTATPSKTTVSAAGETITITVTGKRTTTYTWVNFIGTTTERYTTTADETVSNYTISSSIGTVNGNKITIPYNPNTSDRNITVTVNVSGQTVTKTIVQTKNAVTYSAWQLSASSNVSSVASSGGTVTITAAAWRTYTNSNGQPGGTQNGTISYSPSVGSMSGNVWNIPENTGNPRTNTIIISCVENPSLTKTITVTQDSTSGGGTGGEESDWELKTSFKTSIYSHDTYEDIANFWFEKDGETAQVDSITVDTGKIYELKDITSNDKRVVVWHGLANLTKSSKNIVFTATNNELNITRSVTIVHGSNISHPTNGTWYLHFTNIDGSNYESNSRIVYNIVAMKQGIVPQAGQRNLRFMNTVTSGFAWRHDLSYNHNNTGMANVNGSSNATNLVTIPNGGIVDFYIAKGEGSSTTYTKLCSMTVDVTESKVFDCITNKIYPDNF